MFSDEGIPVWDADAAVGRLYAKDGAGTAEIRQIAPQAVTDRGVDKTVLKALIKQDSRFLKKLEAIIHPLVAKDREEFFQDNKSAEIVLLDIPLLFENGTEDHMDVVIVVSTTADVQKQRVLSRGTMDEDTFNLILSKQMPDAQKRQRADHVIQTTSIENARKQVQKILHYIRSQ
jgi:dephospho-CoA kinase